MDRTLDCRRYGLAHIWLLLRSFLTVGLSYSALWMFWDLLLHQFNLSILGGTCDMLAFQLTLWRTLILRFRPGRGRCIKFRPEHLAVPMKILGIAARAESVYAFCVRDARCLAWVLIRPPSLHPLNDKFNPAPA